jgi:hypothetical protein
MRQYASCQIYLTLHHLCKLHHRYDSYQFLSLHDKRRFPCPSRMSFHLSSVSSDDLWSHVVDHFLHNCSHYSYIWFMQLFYYMDTTVNSCPHTLCIPVEDLGSEAQKQLPKGSYHKYSLILTCTPFTAYFHISEFLMWQHSWLRDCATSRKVIGSIPNEVIGFFNWTNPSSSTVALGSIQPPTEMSTRNLCGGKGQPVCKAGNLTTICEPTV